ncbi:MAG: hypothetical protein NTV23_17135 [Propionibacteriales bacterium]|nr:hypothetical protein [Propionibacteriales bacterium]
MKNQVALIVAAFALVGSAVIGGWALIAGDDSGGSDPSTATGSTAGPSEVPGDVAPGAERPGGGFAIPEKRVNPLSGASYCRTVKLLAIYSRQGYGLNDSQGIVDGPQFDTRLKVIAATYTRLAAQAAGTPHAVGAARSWRAMAVATADAEEQLRVAGLQAQSQVMIVKLAQLGQVIRAELPRATASLKRACGYSPSVLGL